MKQLSAGCSVTVRGEVKASGGKEQATEVHAAEVIVHGWADPEAYPLQKKRHSFEKLREWAHLRPRTNTFGAVARVRNRICRSIHDFFQEEGFSTCTRRSSRPATAKGPGEMFRVSTIDPAKPPRNDKGDVDYAQDFFHRPAYLTVSGQLEGEIYATALGKIYTFGPTFRAENSNTTRHLAEFWMVEPEAAFFELDDNMALAERFLKRICRDVLADCQEDMQFFAEHVDKSVLDRLEERRRPRLPPAELHRGGRDSESVRQDVRIPGRVGPRPAGRARTLSHRRKIQRAGRSCTTTRPRSNRFTCA